VYQFQVGQTVCLNEQIWYRGIKFPEGEPAVFLGSDAIGRGMITVKDGDWAEYDLGLGLHLIRPDHAKDPRQKGYEGRWRTETAPLFPTYQLLFNRLVPGLGSATTLHGELLRIASAYHNDLWENNNANIRQPHFVKDGGQMIAYSAEHDPSEMSNIAIAMKIGHATYEQVDKFLDWTVQHVLDAEIIRLLGDAPGITPALIRETLGPVVEPEMQLAVAETLGKLFGSEYAKRMILMAANSIQAEAAAEDIKQATMGATESYAGRDTSASVGASAPEAQRL
jgi:hypothetical protein